MEFKKPDFRREVRWVELGPLWNLLEVVEEVKGAEL